MKYLSASETAQKWGISERSVRNYCAQGRVPGAFLAGKTWNIPSDSRKPERSNAKRQQNALLERLVAEKKAKLKGGIYHKVQVELTYNSNHIEGSRLSEDQTRLIFETLTIGTEDGPVRIDDVIETVNHFKAVDKMIDDAKRPISERMIKDLHQTLKEGTNDSLQDWFNVGEYKKLPNEVAGRKTCAPEDVPSEMHLLLTEYDPKAQHTLREIIDFHVRLERIHPFQDGNGRVGRLLIFKECLANDIVPFIIEDEMKGYYYRGLSEWDTEQGFLMDTCLAAQDKFKLALEYFRI